jgi:hypothetical protein
LAKRVRIASRRLPLAILCAALGAEAARASAAAPVNPGRLVSQHVTLLVNAFADWELLHDTSSAPFGRCEPFAFPGRVAHREVSLVSRAVATKDISINGSVVIFPTASAARRALREANDAKQLNCMPSWYEKTMRDRGAPVKATAQRSPIEAPAALHAVHQTIRLRPTSASWFDGGTDELYEFEDAADPRVIYGFDVDSSTNRRIPEAVVEKLLAVATR